MMSEETAFQSDETLVTRMLCGVAVVRGFTSTAAVTSVTAVFAEARLYHETLKRPFWFTLRRPGRKCQPPRSALSTTGAPVTFPRVPRFMLCIRISPAGWKRASFQTILTVLEASLTARRGKSFGGKRL